MKSFILTLILTISAIQATAKDLTAEDGLLKIEKNMSISQENIDSIQQNISIIINNITVLYTSQNQMETQKKGLQSTYKENERILGLQSKEVTKIDVLIAKEKKALEDERLKIQKIEALFVQLKSQQEQRTQNILVYQTTKDKFINSKDKGAENQKIITQSILEVEKGIQATKKEVQTWNSKKKLSEHEIAKWSNEKEKHLKMKEEIKILLNN